MGTECTVPFRIILYYMRMVVIKEFYKTLLNLIVIVSLLLALCVAVDYATNDNEIITSNETATAIPENTTIINGSYVLDKDVGIAKTDGKLYTDKSVKTKKTKAPRITITSKPSCGCNYGYWWHTNTFVNYCPYCHKYGTLYNAHKYPARYEQELTCRRCGSDWCGCCGKEKYSWSRVYLRRA